jgi:hypothetical protein
LKEKFQTEAFYQMTNLYNFSKWELYDPQIDNNPPPGCPPRWSGDEQSNLQRVIYRLNLGYHFVNHFHHGDTNTLGLFEINNAYQGMHSCDVEALRNGPRYSILWTLACDVNNFRRKECISEYFMKNPNGGCVAFIGNSCDGQFSQYPQDFTFFKSLFMCSCYRIGEAFSNMFSSCYCWRNGWQASYSPAKMHLLGSPVMEVWTDNPSKMQVSHSSFITLTPRIFTVRVKDSQSGNPVANALVCLYKSDEVYKRGNTNEDGVVDLWVSPETPGNLYVTVTKHNFTPHNGTCIVIPFSTPYHTAFPEGRHLLRIPNTQNIYMTYEAGGKIYLEYSENEGENWKTEEIGEGLYPALGLNNKGFPWISYTTNGDLICEIMREDSTWKTITIFDGNEGLWAGPPSMALATMPIKEDVIDYAYITYPAYEGTMPDGPREQPPPNTHSYIYVSLFDTTGVNKVTHLIDEGPAEVPVSHPCVGVTPADYIHIAWQQKDEIWYITNAGKVTPENWQNVQWTPKYNLSYTEAISEHPFVESYGDVVYVVWKEGTPGEIIRKQRYAWEPSEYDKWKNPENLSNSSEFNSDYPQMSTGYVTIWQEEDEGHNYKLYANILGNVSCLTPEANDVSYAHTNVLIVDPKIPVYTVYYCYTDEITENELYEVKFDKYKYAPESGEGEGFVYYDGKVGNDIESPYCVTRTGNIDYEDYSIDYGNRLEYLLKYLDPCKYYQLQAVVYQDTTGSIRQNLEVEDTLEATVRAYPAIPETINISISPNSYKEDLEAGLEILRTRGVFASIAEFKLYEYETINDSGGGGSGQQSAGMQKLPIPTILHAPRPNPFTGLTQIRFQIPVKTKVDLKIYNSVGRLVNTLISDEMNPGYYTMTWSSKDEQERTQPNGIYFIRLKTENYDATKKMVLVR